MIIEFGRDVLGHLEEATRREWLVTNGLGGFACGTLAGMNTRRYHGLLVASQRPPTERIVIVSWLEETLTIAGRPHQLACHRYGNLVHPTGHLYLEHFTIDPFPTWRWQVGDVLIEKSLLLVYGENTTVVTYKVFAGHRPVDLEIRPHLLFRDFHGNVFENPGFEDNTSIDGNALSLQPFTNAPTLHLAWDRGQFVRDGYWYRDHRLLEEERRGLPASEDDFSNGYLKVAGIAGRTGTSGGVTLVFSDRPIARIDLSDWRKREERRQAAITGAIPADDPFLHRLLLAADQFLVERQSTGGRSIIAGYPWFNDWGRDSLIALPGLTLVPGRYDDARSILRTFVRSIHRGMVPNCFADQGTTAMYNSVDASLWLFHAVYKFLEYTDDYDFIETEIFPGLATVLEAYLDGTAFGIRMDPADGLLAAGEPGQQLTWMDAKCDGIVFTPREGKAVEVNALWYNALRIHAMLETKFGHDARDHEALARRVRTSFRHAFSNPNLMGLHDVIRPDGSIDSSLRPNQIFAVSLPFPLLEAEQEQQVVEVVFRRLYTSVGLRSLAPQDPDYHGTYGGSRHDRDAAYHQGTVWSYLLGPFISAYLKVNHHSLEANLRASRMLDPVRAHLLHEGCVGSISEIFDGDPPHAAQGAFAQAWSVAEILRCYVEDIKGRRPTLVI